MFIWLLPGKSVIQSVAVRHRLLARTYSESERCSASCSVVSLFAPRYYLAKLHVTLYKSRKYVLCVSLPLWPEHAQQGVIKRMRE